MPDRVKMPPSVPQYYRGVYQQVCEQQEPESIADAFMRAEQKHKRKLGTGGDQLLAKICSYLSSFSSNSLLYGLAVDWLDVHNQIEMLAIGILGNRSDIAHVIAAGHQVVNLLENGEDFDLSGRLNEERTIQMWKANVEESYNSNGYNQMDHLFLQQCREEIRNRFRNGNQNSKKLSTSELLHATLDLI